MTRNTDGRALDKVYAAETPEELGEAYAGYRRRVGMLIPRIGRR